MPTPDLIRLRGMIFFGMHGARAEERSLGQQFKVDIELEADLSLASTSDRLSDTIDYGEVYEVARCVIEGPSRNLLERLADEIATEVLSRFPSVGVRVTVQKPRLPIHGGVMDGVSVEVRRERALG